MSKNIAIDVGSSNLRAAVDLNGRVEVLLDKEGNTTAVCCSDAVTTFVGDRATRACISFRDGERRVGKEDNEPSKTVIGEYF